MAIKASNIYFLTDSFNWISLSVFCNAVQLLAHWLLYSDKQPLRQIETRVGPVLCSPGPHFHHPWQLADVSLSPRLANQSANQSVIIFPSLSFFPLPRWLKLMQILAKLNKVNGRHCAIYFSYRSSWKNYSVCWIKENKTLLFLIKFWTSFEVCFLKNS